jgi:VRR-NUC domain-containing protein
VQVGLTKKCLSGNVEVLPVKGAYASNPADRRAIIMDGAGPCNVEEYACRHFRSLEYSAVIVENSPIHVLFGVYMSPVIQDPADPHSQIVGFGDRHLFDAGMPGKIVWTRLPGDFGKPEYGVRRAEAIKKHLSAVICEPLELQRLFDQWLGPSEDLRQYLWAHRNEQIQVARQLINILPSVALIEMLRYLIEDYWGRRAGWPDLLVYRDNEFFFAEVKSAGDKLGKSQERRVRDNRERLHFPFKLVKVLKRLDHDVAAGPGSGEAEAW